MIKVHPVPDGTMNAVFKEGDTVVLKQTKLEDITNYLVYLIETSNGSQLRRVVKDKGGLVLIEDPDKRQQRVKESEVTGIWEVVGTMGEETEIPEHHHYCEIH